MEGVRSIAIDHVKASGPRRRDFHARFEYRKIEKNNKTNKKTLTFELRLAGTIFNLLIKVINVIF